MSGRIRIGIDLGGTKIEGIALDGSREVERIRVATPRDDYPGTVEAIGGIVDALDARTGTSGSVGVGIPGALAPGTGLVKNANSVWLIGRPLRGDLDARVGRGVRIANDADCFAVSEATDGAGAGANVVFGVIIGTGTGGGVVVGGRLVTGPNGIAGEWGHNPLPWPTDEERPGPACYCGRHGCIERFLSGPGMQDDYTRATGQPRSPLEIVADAEAGDRAALEALGRYEERMARALASVINMLDPDVIVLGGGMSNSASLYARVPALWTPFVFGASETHPVRTRLVRAQHGDSSGVRGAAWLWPES
jgi:fructokinase